MSERDADGWAVMHDRSALPSDEGEPIYLFGPFPSKEVADVIESTMECECKRRVVPLFFPVGVKMMIAALPLDMPMPTEGPVH